jgi:hypothetical protein
VKSQCGLVKYVAIEKLELSEKEIQKKKEIDEPKKETE